MRKYLFGTLAAVSLIALTAPANAQDRWHHGARADHWGNGPGFGFSVGFGAPYGYTNYGYADYGWNTGYDGAYAAAPGCTCGSASYGYYPSSYSYDYYPSSYGYSYGYQPGYAYGYDDEYYGGASVGVSATFGEGRRDFREDRRELRTGHRELREERGIRTRTSLRERGELSEGANVRMRSSSRGERGQLSTTGMGGNDRAQGNFGGNAEFRRNGGMANGSPEPRETAPRTTGGINNGNPNGPFPRSNNNGKPQ
jgi:hypothetical protein